MGGGKHRAATTDRVAAHTPPPTPPERIHTPVIPAPPFPSFLRAPFRHSCAGRNRANRHSCAGRNHPPSPFPNSSLPPKRGEVRWGVGGTERPPSVHPSPPFTRHSRAPPPPLSVIPAQAGTAPPVIPAQAGTTPTPLPPSPIHPSPLLGGRLGGGWEAPSRHQRSSGRPRSPPRTPPERIHTPVIPASPLPSFLRRQEPRKPSFPAQAGTTPPHLQHSYPLSSPSVIPAPPHPVIPAQAGMGAAASACMRCASRDGPPNAHRRTRPHLARVPACAGMTELRNPWGSEERTRSVRPLATSHPPPNLPPKRSLLQKADLGPARGCRPDRA